MSLVTRWSVFNNELFCKSQVYILISYMHMWVMGKCHTCKAYRSNHECVSDDADDEIISWIEQLNCMLKSAIAEVWLRWTADKHTRASTSTDLETKQFPDRCSIELTICVYLWKMYVFWNLVWLRLCGVFRRALHLFWVVFACCRRCIA